MTLKMKARYRLFLCRKSVYYAFDNTSNMPPLGTAMDFTVASLTRIVASIKALPAVNTSNELVVVICIAWPMC